MLKQTLMKRLDDQSSFSEPFDTGTSHRLLHSNIWQHLSIVLFLLLSMGAGLGTATAQAHTRAYVTDEFDSTVSVIDTATNTVVETIPVGAFPFGVAITPDGTRAYVANISGTVSVIDTATNTVVATIPVGVVPLGVAITPDGTRAYVTNAQTDFNTVSVIATATNTVVASIPVGAGPSGVAITPAPQAPTSKEECKHGGYKKFGPPAGPFKNQGQCVSYVEHHSH